MTVKVFIVTTKQTAPIQIGGLWQSVGDAAGDIDGGDFWSEVQDRFPRGVKLKQILIIPEKPFNTRSY